MSSLTVALPADVKATHAPRTKLLWGLALAGCAAAGCSVALALTSDHVIEPGVRATLHVWVMLPYILAGLVAGGAGPTAASAC